MNLHPVHSAAAPCFDGIRRRLAQILRRDTGRLVIAPIDDSLLAGPTDGLGNLSERVAQYAAPESQPDAVVGFRAASALLTTAAPRLPFILNLTASTTMGVHVEKCIVATLEDAVRCGASAVAVHVNFTSRFESVQIRMLGEISSRAAELGMPVMGILYPRREVDGRDDNYDALRSADPAAWARLVSHAVRVGVELGCSLIKTQASPDATSYRMVAEAACGVPVMIAGGPALGPEAFVDRIASALENGMSGVSFGRNLFNRRDARPWIDAAVRLVHGGASREETVACLRSSS